MRNAAKKIPRNFRIDADLNEELERRSKLTGIGQTTIVERALRHYFEEEMKRQLGIVVRELRPFDYPLTPLEHDAKRQDGIVGVASSSLADSTRQLEFEINKIAMGYVGRLHQGGALSAVGELSLSE